MWPLSYSRTAAAARPVAGRGRCAPGDARVVECWVPTGQTEPVASSVVQRVSDSTLSRQASVKRPDCVQDHVGRRAEEAHVDAVGRIGGFVVVGMVLDA